jgi:hypothetical protein
VFYSRVLGSLFLFGLGLWFTLDDEARFSMGGRRAIHVDPEGYGAIAVSLFFFGLSIVNLALGFRGRGRIPIFWAGAALVGVALLYGIGQAGLAVWELAHQIAAS